MASVWSSLLHDWLFEGNNTDDKGGDVGTNTGITYSTGNGKIKQGAGFDGSTSKIALATAIAIQATWSVSVWVKMTAGFGNAMVVCDSDAGASNDWFLRVDSTGSIRLAWANSNGNNRSNVTNSNYITDTNWHHIVATISASDALAVIYVDGASVAVTNSGAGSTLPAAQGTRIGSFGLLDSQKFNGAMDMLYLWNRAITSTEVTQLYNSGVGLQYPDVGYLVVPAGSYTLTGIALTLGKGLHFALTAGSYVLTGVAIIFGRGKAIILTAGSYALTGFTLTINKVLHLILTAGNYTLTGFTLSFLRGLHFTVPTGKYTLTGFTLTFWGWLKRKRPSLGTWTKRTRSAIGTWTKRTRPPGH